jgi:pimeloyl-ACP methyl ester carboxylesterase
VSQARANGIFIEYESFGRDSDPALLLVSGWSVQMLAWDEALCRRFAGLGLRVIRFDNRDCGLSTHFDGAEYDVLAAAAAQLRGAAVPAPPYRLSDMADDAIGLLDALGIERAHIAGASMGGMIAQRIAIAYPARVLSLISIMSNTGEPGIGESTPEALAALFTPPPTTRDAYADHIARVARVIGSKTHFDEGAVRARALAGFDRAYYPEGAVRQTGAVMAETSRAEALTQLRVPTLVIHGRQDPLIGCAAGERTAQLIPSASLLILDTAGHDLPEPLWPEIVDAVAGHIERATPKRRFADRIKAWLRRGVDRRT